VAPSRKCVFNDNRSGLVGEHEPFRRSALTAIAWFRFVSGASDGCPPAGVRHRAEPGDRHRAMSCAQSKTELEFRIFIDVECFGRL
jgi:hypothetical protein